MAPYLFFFTFGVVVLVGVFLVMAFKLVSREKTFDGQEVLESDPCTLRIGTYRGRTVGRLYLFERRLFWRPLGFPFFAGGDPPQNIAFGAIGICSIERDEHGLARPLVVRTIEGTVYRFYLNDFFIGRPKNQEKWKDLIDHQVSAVR